MAKHATRILSPAPRTAVRLDPMEPIASPRYCPAHHSERPSGTEGGAGRYLLLPLPAGGAVFAAPDEVPEDAPPEDGMLDPLLSPAPLSAASVR